MFVAVAVMVNTEMGPRVVTRPLGRLLSEVRDVVGDGETWGCETNWWSFYFDFDRRLSIPQSLTLQWYSVCRLV